MNASSPKRHLLLLLMIAVLTMIVGVQPAVAQTSPAGSPTETAASSPARAASPTAAPTAAQPDEAPPTAEKPVANARTAPTGNWIYVLAIALILLLGFLFYLLLMWASRHEQSSYLGSLFRDSVEEFEYKRFAQPHIEKWINFGYHAHARQDAETKQKVKTRKEAEATATRKANEERQPGDRMPLPGGYGTGPGSGPPGLIGTGSGFEPEEEETARKNYDHDLAEARKKAAQRAEGAANVDLNVLRGRGSEFVLDFTAVVTLVFAVTILGLLNILDAQSISTLLAAIAGYVLGRASNRKQGETRTGITTAEVTELIHAVTGNKPVKAPAKKTEAPEESPADTAAPSNAPAKEETN